MKDEELNRKPDLSDHMMNQKIPLFGKILITVEAIFLTIFVIFLARYELFEVTLSYLSK